MSCSLQTHAAEIANDAPIMPDSYEYLRAFSVDYIDEVIGDKLPPILIRTGRFRGAAVT